MRITAHTGGVLALLLSSTIWGSSFVLAKFVLAELPVGHVVLYRFLVAAVVFLPVLLVSDMRPSRRDLPLFALTGFLMVPVTYLLQFGGLALTSASSTALLIGTGAPLLAVGAVLFERERLGRRGWTAIAVSSLGVLWLVGLPGEGDDWRGNLLVFGSMIVAAVWVLLSKRLVERYPVVPATGWIVVFGTLSLIPVSLAWNGAPSASLSAIAWLSLLGLGLGCTVAALILWNWGVAKVGAGPAGVYLNLEPIAGVVLAVIALGEPLTAGLVGGGALIVGAAGMVCTPGATA